MNITMPGCQDKVDETIVTSALQAGISLAAYRSKKDTGALTTDHALNCGSGISLGIYISYFL